MKVAIVGGAGKFGEHLGQALESRAEIAISDSSIVRARDVAEEHGWDYGSNIEVVEIADIVIVSVPIKAAVDVIHEIGPHVDEETLLCDVTSVKQKPCEAMEKYSEEALGMHPMYAPSNSISGQKVVLCPVSGKKWEVMREFWTEKGAELHVTDPESHDEAMSVVQGATHFAELVIAETVRRSDLELEELENYSSPIFRLMTDLSARMLNQQPELYHAIQAENPEIRRARQDFIQAAEDIDEAVGTEKFSELFEDMGEEFDLERAQETTDEVIEFLRNKIK